MRKFWGMQIDTAYWEVRRAIIIVAYFEGLRMAECMQLELEKFTRTAEGYQIVHSRAKQRTDKMSTKFLVPDKGGFANMLDVYLKKVKEQLNIYSGKVWFTGRKSSFLVAQPMGKNSMAKVPHELAVLLHLPNVSSYTFHSFRRTSATRAADAGASSEQLVDFFGWKNSSMCKEYISSSKPAIMEMATKLASAGSQANKVATLGRSGPATAAVPLTEYLPAEEEGFPDLEEDLEMLEEAGIPTQQNILVKKINSSSTVTEDTIGNSVKQALSAIPGSSNINLKVIVITNLSGNVHF